MNQMIDTNVKGVFYVTRAVVPGAFCPEPLIWLVLTGGRHD